MLSIQIKDIRTFTKLLFSEDAFDRFLLHDAQFVTNITTVIDGRIIPEFYPEEEREAALHESCISYSEMRPRLYDLIRGKRLPVTFKLVLLTSKSTVTALLRKNSAEDLPVSSLSMNIHYREGSIYLTTGIAYSGFTMDKSMEHVWDSEVLRFLDKKECAYEELS